MFLMLFHFSTAAVLTFLKKWLKVAQRKSTPNDTGIWKR